MGGRGGVASWRTWWQRERRAPYQPDHCTYLDPRTTAPMGKHTSGTPAAPSLREKSASSRSIPELFRPLTQENTTTKASKMAPSSAHATKGSDNDSTLSCEDTSKQREPVSTTPLAYMTSIAADVKGTLNAAIKEEVRGISDRLDEVVQAGTVREGHSPLRQDLGALCVPPNHSKQAGRGLG